MAGMAEIDPHDYLKLAVAFGGVSVHSAPRREVSSQTFICDPKKTEMVLSMILACRLDEIGLRVSTLPTRMPTEILPTLVATVVFHDREFHWCVSRMDDEIARRTLDGGVTWPDAVEMCLQRIRSGGVFGATCYAPL